jgi:hypothetical protein
MKEDGVAKTIPGQCPVCGGRLAVSELSCPSCDTTVRGTLDLCEFCQLPPEDLRFLRTFLRCRGNIKDVERELGISYPTVRGRLDSLLEKLGYQKVVPKMGKQEKLEILAKLERGEISPEEALKALKDGGY